MLPSGFFSVDIFLTTFLGRRSTTSIMLSPAFKV
jgi:hypothetical protein